MDKIKASLYRMDVGGFKSEEDSKAFDKLKDGSWNFNEGITITPFYSKEGELMSFIVDSDKASKLIEKKCTILKKSENRC